MVSADSSTAGLELCDEPLVVFMHIPKTAGNTMRATLEAVYSDAYLDSWIHSAAAPDGTPVTVQASSPEVSAIMREVSTGRTRCIGSNLPYGLHRHLGRPVDYVTFVREPVARCISRWYFAYRMRDERPMWRAYEACGFDLERILRELVDFCLVDDQIRNITGLPIARPKRDDLEKAQSLILSAYRFVGVTEQFEQCIDHLRTIYGWPVVDVEPRNVGDKSDASLLPANARELFADANRLDDELYRWIADSYLPLVTRRTSSVAGRQIA